MLTNDTENCFGAVFALAIIRPYLCTIWVYRIITTGRISQTQHNSHHTVQRAQERWQFQSSKSNSRRHHLGSVIHNHTVLLVAADCMGQAEGKHFHSMTNCRKGRPRGCDPDEQVKVMSKLEL